MIRKYFSIILLFLIPLAGYSQSLSVSVKGNNSSSTFSLEEGKILVNSSKITFSPAGTSVAGLLGYGISPDLSTVGILTTAAGGSRATVFDARGDTLSSFEVTNLSKSDPSVAVYPFDNGSLLVRDNIASFSLYDSFGEITNTISNSSQSQGGEAISEVAMDAGGRTIVLYNPKIKRNGKLGSQVSVVNADNKATSIFSSQDHFIKAARVSEDGQFIALLTSGGGSDEVIFMDRFGNKLNTITSDENLRGLRISSDAQYLTLFSNNRVMVYQALSSKREASTSFRAPVVLANYFPDESIILGLTGQYSVSSGHVTGAEFHAVSVEKRKIAHKELGSSLTFSPALQSDFVRTASYQYQLEGTNKQVGLKASF